MERNEIRIDKADETVAKDAYTTQTYIQIDMCHHGEMDGWSEKEPMIPYMVKHTRSIGMPSI